MHLLCIIATTSNDELSFGVCLPRLNSPPSYVSPPMSSCLPAPGPAFHSTSLSFAWRGSPRPAWEASAASDLRVESARRFPTFKALALGSSGWNPLVISEAIDLAQHWSPILSLFLLGNWATEFAILGPSAAVPVWTTSSLAGLLPPQSCLQSYHLQSTAHTIDQMTFQSLNQCLLGTCSVPGLGFQRWRRYHQPLPLNDL